MSLKKLFCLLFLMTLMAKTALLTTLTTKGQFPQLKSKAIYDSFLQIKIFMLCNSNNSKIKLSNWGFYFKPSK